MKMDTLISSLVPPGFEKASRVNSRKRRNRKTFSRTAKSSHTNKHAGNVRSSGLSTRASNRNPSSRNVSQKFKSKGAAHDTRGFSSSTTTAVPHPNIHHIALQQIHSSKRGQLDTSTSRSVSTGAEDHATAERHKLYFSAFESNSSSAIASDLGGVTSHRTSDSTDARMTAYQRDERSKAFSGYPPSQARGLNDAPANRAPHGENHAQASFAPNAVHATRTSLSEQTTAPPPPPPPSLPGLPPHAHTSHAHSHMHAFYQGSTQGQQHIGYPPHVGFVPNSYSHDQSTYNGVLGATQATVMQVNQPQRRPNAAAAAVHPWGMDAAGLHGLTSSVSIPPSGVNFASQAHLQAPIGHAHAHNSSAHSSSFFVLPDENTRPPTFTSSASQNDPSRARISSTDASLSHPLAQNHRTQIQHELGPYTHPLPLNSKQVASSQNVHPDSTKNGAGVNMPPNCVTDENSAFNGNFAQPPTKTLSNSVQTESRGKLSSTNVGFRQTSMRAPQTNSNSSQLDQNSNSDVRPPLSEQSLYPKCGNRQQEKSVKEEEASPPVANTTGEGEAVRVALMTDEIGADAANQMDVVKPAGNSNGVVTQTHRSPRARMKGGRTLSAEQQANDCDLFFDADEILAGMRQSESEFAPLILKDYMSVQKSLNNRMRLIVIDWLYEVEQEYTLDDRTMFLAVNYLDRFLSQVHLRRDQLQLVGTTCLYLASKFQEIDPPTAAQYTFIADKTFSIDQLFQMESCVLDVLNFRLAATTSYDFLLTFIMKLELPEKIEKFALYLLSLFVESVNYGRFLPSQEAAAAIYLAKLYIFGDDSWTVEHERVCNFGVEDLKEVVRLYDAMHRTQYEHFVKHFLFDRGAPGHAVSDKFASTHYGEVSKVIAPLNYGGPRITQPCDPQKLRQGTIQCRCPHPKCQPLRR